MEDTNPRADVLIVSTVAHAEDKLRDLVDAAATARVVVPVVGEGLVGWLANDEGAFSKALEEARRLGERLPVDAVETGAGESNIALAIQDALAETPASEVIIVTSPADERRVAEGLARIQIPLDAIPIRLVTLDRDGGIRA